MSERMWSYRWNRALYGPIPESGLRAMLAGGTLPPDTLVWTQGMLDWADATQVGLFPSGPRLPEVSPSELIFLHGEHFGQGGRAFPAGYTLPHRGLKVSAMVLSSTMLTVAVLANEQAGAFRLVPQERRTMLGLRTVSTLFVEATGVAVTWPQGSLEEAMLTYLIKYRRPLDVMDLLAVAMQTNSYDPHSSLLHRTGNVLAKRGVLAQWAALVSQPPTVPAQLLEVTRLQRFDILRRIELAVGRAVSMRTESPNSDE